MLRLQPVPLMGVQGFHARPAVWRPAHAPMSAPAPRLGQIGTIGTAGTVTMLVGAGISGGIGYAGYYLATHQKPVGWKVLGYGVAILGGLSALSSLLGALFWSSGANYVNQQSVFPGAVLTSPQF